MEQHELRPPRGAKKNRKRIGRGNASGKGTYSGKGLKGQQARSGYKTRPAFEGGQTPMVRRLPRRRGFNNPFRIEFQPVNLRDLASFSADSEVTPETLQAAGVIRSVRQPVKLLGNGDITAALTVKTHRVSSTAKAKIEAAGGTVVETLPRKDPSEKRERGKSKSAPVAEAADTPDEPSDGETEEEASDSSDESSESATAE